MNTDFSSGKVELRLVTVVASSLVRNLPGHTASIDPQDDRRCFTRDWQLGNDSRGCVFRAFAGRVGGGIVDIQRADVRPIRKALVLVGRLARQGDESQVSIVLASGAGYLVFYTIGQPRWSGQT